MFLKVALLLRTLPSVSQKLQSLFKFCSHNLEVAGSLSIDEEEKYLKFVFAFGELKVVSTAYRRPRVPYESCEPAGFMKHYSQNCQEWVHFFI